MSKLTAGHYAEFTLVGSDKVRTSGVIVTTGDHISYCDEETKLLCFLPPEDVAKVHKSVPATPEQLKWQVKSEAPTRIKLRDLTQVVPIANPKGKKAAPVAPVVNHKGKKASPALESNIGSGSKVDRAYALATQNPGHTKDQLVDLFVDQLNMSPAGAQTYYYNVMKRMARKD